MVRCQRWDLGSSPAWQQSAACTVSYIAIYGEGKMMSDTAQVCWYCSFWCFNLSAVVLTPWKLGLLDTKDDPEQGKVFFTINCIYHFPRHEFQGTAHPWCASSRIITGSRNRLFVKLSGKKHGRCHYWPAKNANCLVVLLILWLQCNESLTPDKRVNQEYWRKASRPYLHPFFRSVTSKVIVWPLLVLM